MSAHHVRDHCLSPTRAVDAPIYGGRYGRLLPGLGPLATDPPLLHALGRSGGPSDGARLADAGGDDAREAAGWPLFGQFIAHDLTADRSPVTGGEPLPLSARGHGEAAPGAKRRRPARRPPAQF